MPMSLIVFNDFQEEQEEEKKVEETKDEEGMWEENFKEHHDSKPRGLSHIEVTVHASQCKITCIVL
jgi:hypothetical protein